MPCCKVAVGTGRVPHHPAGCRHRQPAVLSWHSGGGQSPGAFHSSRRGSETLGTGSLHLALISDQGSDLILLMVHEEIAATFGPVPIATWLQGQSPSLQVFQQLSPAKSALGFGPRWDAQDAAVGPHQQHNDGASLFSALSHWFRAHNF